MEYPYDLSGAVFGNSLPGQQTVDFAVPDTVQDMNHYSHFSSGEPAYYNDGYKPVSQANYGQSFGRSMAAISVKAENTASVHLSYPCGLPTPPHHLHHGERAFFDHQFPMSTSGPVSPYGNVSEGTVSSTVSSPKTPPGAVTGYQIRHTGGLGDDELNTVSDDQLTQMSARDLNKYFKQYNPNVITQLKKKRRTLKNRGYALNSRMKRVQQKTELESERDSLKKTVSDLTMEITQLKKELEECKRKVSTYENYVNGSSKSPSR